MPEPGERGTGAVPLVLYTRPGCHLCDVMHAAVAGARLHGAAALELVDISGDAALEARFGRSIPVLAIAGRVAFKGRLEVGELERKYARLARAWRGERG
jgi:hypothetical protein